MITRCLLLAALLCGCDERTEVFVQKDACPFECCTFGMWEVLAEAPIHEKPAGSAPVIAALAPESTVEVTTGEVHVQPGLARVTGEPHWSAKTLDVDSEIEILDYVGEGYSRVRQGGALTHVKIARTKEACIRNPSERYCWVELIREPVTEWWVRLGEAPDHPGGWVRMGDGALRAIDACS